jgi:hypothetical protein
MKNSKGLSEKIKILLTIAIVLIGPALLSIPKTAQAYKNCPPNTFFGTVTYNGAAINGATVTLTDLTSGEPSLTATTYGHKHKAGYYLIELADYQTCKLVEHQFEITASFNGSSASVTLTYTGQNSAPVNLDIISSTSILTSISIVPTSTFINVGAIQPFVATGLDQNGVALVTQPKLTWTSNNPAIAIINASGTATGIMAGGPITITAASGTIFAAANLTVITPNIVPMLTSIVVSPNPISIYAGAMQKFNATGLDQNGIALAVQPKFIWTSSNSDIATVDASGTATGIADGGPIEITAASGTISAFANLTVIASASAQVLTSISVTPDPISIYIGSTQMFTATGLDQNGIALAVQPKFIWTSSNPDIATVDASGTAAGIAAGGPIIITAASGTISAFANLTVITPNIAPILTSIVVSPNPISIYTGSTQSFLATGFDQNGVALTVQPNFSWTSSDPAIAAIDASGTATGIMAGGPLTITAATGTISGIANLTVKSLTQNPVVSPLTALPPAGKYFQAIDVSLVATGSPSIMFTTNGTVPTCQVGNVYTAPIHLMQSTSIKAVACYGLSSSTIASFDYEIELEFDSSDLSELHRGNIFQEEAGCPATSTPSVTVTYPITIKVKAGQGTSTINISAGAIITPIGGGNFDDTLIDAHDVSEDTITGLDSGVVVDGALHWGIANFGLAFNPAINISIFVGTSLNGSTLNIMRSTSGNSSWTSDGIVTPTCVVANGLCSFSTLKASYYSISQPPTPPSVPVSSGSSGGSGGGSVNPTVSVDNNLLTISPTYTGILTMKFPDGNSVIVRVPPGAVSRTTTFNVEENTPSAELMPLNSTKVNIVGGKIFNLTAIDSDRKNLSSFMKLINANITIPAMTSNTGKIGAYYFDSLSNAWKLINDAVIYISGNNAVMNLNRPAMLALIETNNLAKTITVKAINQESGSNNEVVPITPVTPTKPEVLGKKAYGNGTLIRVIGTKKIYVIINGQKKHILDMKELKKYAGKPILNITADQFDQYSDYVKSASEPASVSNSQIGEGSLVRDSEMRIYVIKNGKKVYIPNVTDLKKYKGKIIHDLNDNQISEFAPS